MFNFKSKMSCSSCYNTLTYKDYGVFCDKCDERVILNHYLKNSEVPVVGTPISQTKYNSNLYCDDSEHRIIRRDNSQLKKLPFLEISKNITQGKLRNITLDISPIGHPVDDYYGWITKTYNINISKTEFNDILKKKFNYHVKDSKWNC
jgi:hypothetical protein